MPNKTNYYVIFPQPDQTIDSSTEEKQHNEKKKPTKQVKKYSTNFINQQDEMQTCSLLKSTPLDGNSKCAQACYWCERKKQNVSHSISTSTDDLEKDYIKSLNKLRFNETMKEVEKNQQKVDKIDLSVYQVQNSNVEVKQNKHTETKVNDSLVHSESPLKLCELTVYSVKFPLENRFLK